jgi:uncharacterized membrane protein (UPF0182 family)
MELKNFVDARLQHVPLIGNLQLAITVNKFTTLVIEKLVLVGNALQTHSSYISKKIKIELCSTNII